MKITMYELLALIKDGKAPKKIKFCGNIYEWKDDWYLTKEKNYKVCLGGKKEDHNILITAFNEDVEVIEEPKKIEKISWREKESLAGEFTANEKQDILARRTEKLKSSLNELIDEINNLKEK